MINRATSLSIFIRAVLTLFSLCITAQLYAGEVYKWTDENGRVHYGDKHTAPQSSETINVPESSQPGTMEEMAKTPKKSKKLNDPVAIWGPSKDVSADPKQVKWKPKGVPVDPKRVDPRCNELGQTMSDMPPGKPFKHLSDEVISLCPGVGYECRRYRTHPEDNKCIAIVRSDKDPMVKTWETD